MTLYFPRNYNIPIPIATASLGGKRVEQVYKKSMRRWLCKLRPQLIPFNNLLNESHFSSTLTSWSSRIALQLYLKQDTAFQKSISFCIKCMTQYAAVQGGGLTWEMQPSGQGQNLNRAFKKMNPWRNCEDLLNYKVTNSRLQGEANWCMGFPIP